MQRRLRRHPGHSDRLSRFPIRILYRLADHSDESLILNIDKALNYLPVSLYFIFSKSSPARSEPFIKNTGDPDQDQGHTQYGGRGDPLPQHQPSQENGDDRVYIGVGHNHGDGKCAHSNDKGSEAAQRA